MAELPMFPLGTALVPGAPLPLHVFEPRYRALVQRCLAGDGTFGVVLIERGSEVGGGEVRTDVGCRAQIVRAGQLPDGRYALAAVGVERLRVTRWLPDDPHPWADVEPWPDEPDPDTPRAPDTPDTRAALAAALDDVGALQAAVTGGPGPAPDAGLDLAPELGDAAYQAALRAGLGPLDLHRLLCCPAPRARAQLAVELVRGQAELLAAVLGTGEGGGRAPGP